MKLESLYLAGFGKFANREIKFNERFNVLLGPNEAGKTTVINAIFGVLFGFKGRSDDIRSLKARYRPWDPALPYMASVTFQDGLGHRYRINRNFAEDKPEVFLWSREGFIPAGQTLEQILEQCLGIKNMRLFESTLLIRQQEIASLDHGQLSEAITQKITEGGNEVLIKDVFKTLQEQQKDLSRGIDRLAARPGLIVSLTKEIQELEEKISELEKHEIDYCNLKKSLREKSRRQEFITTRLAETEPLLADLQSLSELTAKKSWILEQQKELQLKINKIKDKEDSLNRCTKSLEKIKPYAAYLAEENLHRLEHLSAKVKNLAYSIDLLDSRIADHRRTAEQLQEEIEHKSHNLNQYYRVKYNQSNLLEAQRVSDLLCEYREALELKENEYAKYAGEQQPTVRRMKIWPGILMIIFSISGLLLGDIYGYVLFAFMLLAGTVMLFLSMSGKNRNNAEKQILSHLSADIERIKQNISNNQRILHGLIGDEDLEAFKTRVLEMSALEKEVDLLESKIAELNITAMQDELAGLLAEKNRLQSEINEILQKSRSKDIEDFRANLSEYRQLQNELHLLSETLEILCEGKSRVQYEEALAELGVELYNTDKQIEQLAVPGDKVDLDALTKERDLLQQEKSSLSAQILQLETGIRHYEDTVFKNIDIWGLKDKLTVKRKELNKYTRQSKSLDLTIAVMQEAVKEAQSELAPGIRDQVEQVFGAITANRYTKADIRIEEGKMIFQVLAPETGSYTDAANLSTGARDQFYLALRVALGNYITNGKAFPLFLDDPFINFDENRLLNTLAILRELAATNQIIWLTKDVSFVDTLREIDIAYI